MNPDCTRTTNEPNVRVEEKKRKAIFKNPTRSPYSVSIVDGCLITSGPRADFLVSEIGSVSALVELKGSDISHACKQLFASAVHENVKPLLEEKILFLVVCSRFPRFDTSVAKAKEASKKKYGAKFHVCEGNREYELKKFL